MCIVLHRFDIELHYFLFYSNTNIKGWAFRSHHACNETTIHFRNTDGIKKHLGTVNIV